MTTYLKTIRIKKTLSLGLLLLVVLSISAQSKKEVQNKLDSLIIEHELLIKNNYELKNTLELHEKMYADIKKEVFDAEELDLSINEGGEVLKQSITTIKNEISKSAKIQDSLKTQLEINKEECDQLIIENKICRNYLLGAAEEASFPASESEFKGSWNLYLKPMQMTGDAYESGFISTNPFLINDTIQAKYIYKIDFGDDELASLHFKGGESIKVFYKFDGFNVNSPYRVTFTKQDEFKLVAHISPMPDGLEISYETPLLTDKIIYFHGIIKK